mgnify:CR=1 FL=1
MISYFPTAHAAPFAFIDNVLQLNRKPIIATTQWTNAPHYHTYWRHPWPLWLECLAPASGVHLRPRLTDFPSGHYYLSAVNRVVLFRPETLLTPITLVAQHQRTLLQQSHCYLCRAFDPQRRPLLRCSLMLTAATELNRTRHDEFTPKRRH